MPGRAEIATIFLVSVLRTWHVDRMVYVNDEVDLLDAPDGVSVGRLSAGALLLREEHEGAWTLIRVPSDTTAGWVLDETLRPLSRTSGG